MLDNIYPKPQEITLDIDRGLSIIVYFRRNAVILFLLLTSCFHTQFIRRWNWQNAQNAE